jgi:hypothetical protein
MSASAKLVCVDPTRIHHVWDAAAPLVLRAMQRGGQGLFEKVEQDVLRGEMLLWLAWNGEKIEGAGVTELSKTENGKICTIVAWSTSDMRRDLGLLSIIEKFAKKEGCKAVRLYGRRGWARVLRDYSQPSVILEKEV